MVEPNPAIPPQRPPDEDDAGVPVFRPTAADFGDFAAFIARVEPECAKFGCFKVIPLEGWFTPPDYATASLTVRGPVEQHVIGTSNGVLKLALVECANASLAVFRSCARQFAPPEGVPVTDAFWASITPGSEPAVYGADTSGTLFDRKQCHPWNLNHLGTILDRVRQRIPGVTSPMLYVGAWRAMFGIHKEDVDLYSINYLHFGAPKTWYCLPRSAGSRLEQLVAAAYPHDQCECRQFLRHKLYMVPPSQLRKHHIPYSTVTQHAGEFMVTLPGAYHMGFNHGYNIAEAVNFASPTWVPIGQAAKVCTCQRQSVRLDMELFSDVATARRSQRASLARPQATSESANASAAPMPEPSAAATFAPGAPAVSAPPPAPEPDAHAAGGRQLQLKDMWSVRRSLDAGASGGRPRKRKRSHGATLADAVELWARLGRQPPDGSPHEGGATPAPRLNEVVSVQVLPGTVVDAVVVKLSDDASLVKVQGVSNAEPLPAKWISVHYIVQGWV